jgi:hypothetical protein
MDGREELAMGRGGDKKTQGGQLAALSDFQVE